MQSFLKGAKTATDIAGGALRGAGNIASQAVGGVTQAAGAGIGGFQRGMSGARSGHNMSAIAPSYGGGGSTADNVIAQQASQAGQSGAVSRSAGDSELADLRARLDSIENLLKSKP